MQLRDVFIATLVALVWGSNFLVAKVGTEEIPPFLFLCLRTLGATLPFIFFIPKPKNLSWSLLSGIALSLNVGKMSFVFWSLYLGLSPGIASLALQTQVLFTMILARILFKNHISLKQISGIIVAIIGMAIIGFDMHGNTSFSGFICILCAAFLWAVANMLFTKAKDVDTFSLVIWTGVVPPIPLFLLSLTFEGWDVIVNSLESVTWIGITSLVFTIVAATWVGVTCWALLFRRNEASLVAPYALLIPVVAITMSMLILGDSYSPLTLMACGVVFLGLVINQWPSKKTRKNEKKHHISKKAA